MRTTLLQVTGRRAWTKQQRQRAANQAHTTAHPPLIATPRTHLHPRASQAFAACVFNSGHCAGVKGLCTQKPAQTKKGQSAGSAAADSRDSCLVPG